MSFRKTIMSPVIDLYLVTILSPVIHPQKQARFTEKENAMNKRPQPLTPNTNPYP